MPNIQKAVEGLQNGADVLFLLVGAVLVFAMHGGFAFLEAGTVRHKNQVNALCKILVDFAISTVAYFFIGYAIAYGVAFFVSAEQLNGAGKGFDPQGLSLAKFFFLATFAAAVPAIVSGGIAERAKFGAQCTATALIVALFYPLLEGVAWNKNFGLQEHFFKGTLGEEFHDFAGSIVVHAVGGWIGFSAVRQLGPRLGRYDKGRATGIPPSSIPWLAMGSWLLCIGWFGFNVMSAQSLKGVTGLIALNSLMAMCGGVIAATIAGDSDPGFIHNGALAGLVAVCAGSDVMHPIGALFVGGVAGALFVYTFQKAGDPKWSFDDVLGVWALHGLCGLWGGIACGIFGLKEFGGLGGVGFTSQLVGSLMGAAYGAIAGFVVYRTVDVLLGLRLGADDERRGADLAVHKITANPEEDVRMGRI
ncbi:MAG: ammonium transporter [Alphaproteobacteria bacterium]|nr:MAG: ammonium transporter [Alphaproteobacteria bacterium]